MSKKTTNYDMFKKHESNRPLAKENLEKVKKSIQIKNLLEYRPILVDENYFIVDGQHRLAAAKELGVEIFYDIQKNGATSDMFLLNANQRRWTPDDYFNFYEKEGIQDYIKLKSFLKKNKITLRQAVLLFKKFSRDGINLPGGELFEVFNSGKLVYPSEEIICNIEELLNKIVIVKDYIIQKMPSKGESYYVNTNKFVSALVDFFVIYPIEFEEFMKKIPFKLDIFRPCAKRSQYLDIFKEVYNYRNQRPIFD